MKRRRSELTREQNKIRKWTAVQNRFKELYDGERLRIDDVFDRLADEFYISVDQVHHIMRQDLPEVPEEKPDPAPNQLDLFTGQRFDQKNQPVEEVSKCS